ncbi:hypothetical protein JZ751_005851 [Albula glossodonta]|uniref:PNPLA domain-containing protein n=1 Tax=Albula glossodonta TaxID=121402 RepID=A0A8T2P358_9TELE|nr:hypothetical protein JZ751_005851 [Albula glossodonta]
MFDLKGEWNISFAGCGFLGIYHIGVASCLLERAPYLVKGATRIYGASAGALTGAVLACGVSIAQCCEDVIAVAKEARKRSLGPLHPSFNLVKVLRAGLSRDLPEDAHLRASGRLCVSLTRVSDRQNVLVSEFRSKEELIQVSAPERARNNLPRCDLKDTITVSPFSGESDICPRDNSFSFHEARLTNTSVHVNLGNMYRLTKALFPPEPKVLAEMCQNGYKDALRFLQENNLLKPESPSAGLSVTEVKPPSLTCCCSGERKSQSTAGKPVPTETTREWLLRRLRLLRKRHWWLDEQIVDNLPPPLKKGRARTLHLAHVVSSKIHQLTAVRAMVKGLLPVRVASYMLLPYTLPVESAYSITQRLVEWVPEVPADVRWLCGVAGAMYNQVWRGAGAESTSEVPLRKCLSVSPVTDLSGTGRGVVRDGVGPLQLSCMDLPSSFWNAPNSSDPSILHRLKTPSPSPKQVCFFVGSTDDYDPEHCQEYQDPMPQVVEELQDGLPCGCDPVP